MATKIESTEITQPKKVFVKSEEALDEMEANGQLEPFTDYYTEDESETETFEFAESERLKTLNKFSSDIVQGAWYFATGNYGTATEYICNKTKISVKPNTAYTISFGSTTGDVSFVGYIVYDSAGSMIGSQSFENQTITKCTFTTPSNAYYICFDFWRGSYTATITPDQITNVMLNEGSTALSYQPYYGNIVHKKEMAGAFAPSDVYEDLGTSTSFEFTAPANGYIAYKGVSGTNLTSFAVVSGNNEGFEYVFGLQGLGQQRYVPVRKGKKYIIAHSNVAISHSWGFYIRFYYAQGEL